MTVRARTLGGARIRNPYGVLGLRRQAGLAEIHVAYLRALKGSSPERAAAAFAILSNPQRRELYDREHSSRGVRVTLPPRHLAPIAVAAISAVGLLAGGVLATPALVAKGQSVLSHPLFGASAGGRPLHAVKPAQASHASPSPPAAAVLLKPRPDDATLKPADLPSGYHVLSESPAAFKPFAGSTAPPSWDVVFQSDPGQHSNRLVESLSVIYPSHAQAQDALDQQASLEQSTGATERQPSIKLGDRVSVWAEPAPNVRGYEVVRVTWLVNNVLAQVSLLAPIGSGQDETAARLAAVQQRRITGTSET